MLLGLSPISAPFQSSNTAVKSFLFSIESPAALVRAHGLRSAHPLSIVLSFTHSPSALRARQKSQPFVLRFVIAVAAAEREV